MGDSETQVTLAQCTNNICGLMERSDNIRNISVVAQVDHGKTTLVNCLVSRAGTFHFTEASNTQIANTKDEEKHLIPSYSTAISMSFEFDAGELHATKRATDGNNFLINLIDPPGHIDVLSETTAALRVSDGALVVVDCVEGVCVQTETMIRQAITERIKPVAIINKIDRPILELQTSKESLFQSFKRAVENINVIISTYHDAALGNIQLYPEEGTVAFASGLEGWGFTLCQFAARYSKKFGIDEEKLMAKLWGDNFYDRATRKWTTRSNDGGGKMNDRAFNMFILDPIFKIFDVTLNSKASIASILERLDITLTSDERDLGGRALLKIIMHKFLPIGDSILKMTVFHLPSPAAAQQYRVETLYEGPMDDESATGIRQCDLNGPLVFYVSKMVPTSGNGRFYAFGRVFSGTVRSGSTVRIQGPNYVPGKKNDFFVKTIERAVLMMGQFVSPIDGCPAGNICGLAGIDQFLLKSGTITSAETAHNLKAMKFSTPPDVQVAVEVKNPTDLPKLVEAIKRLTQIHTGVQTWITETGEHVVAGAGDLYLEVCLKDLQDLTGIALKVSEPVIQYRETVKAESSIVAISKSQNKHDRFYVKALPLDEELTKSIEYGQVSPRDDGKARSRVLEDEYGWDVANAKKIWAFGPDTTGPNLLVDVTKGVQHLNEIKGSCVQGFQWATKEGVCAEENMRGIQFNIIDVTLASTAIHRGAGQIVPTFRRVCYAAALLATPGIQEPIYLVEIQCPQNAISGIYSCLYERRGRVICEEQRPGALVFMKAYLPVAESFRFSSDLRVRTSSQAYAQIVFDHWETMSGTPIERGSTLEELVIGIRRRKGLRPEIPILERYYDRL